MINWEPLLDQTANPIIILSRRDGCFDSLLIEPGPPAIIMDEDIMLLYNGKNSAKNGDMLIEPDSYSTGIAFFNIKDPSRCKYRSKKPILKPERSYETKRDSYKFGKIYTSSLIFFKSSWFIYYGCSDWAIAAAQYEGTKLQEIGD